MVAPSCIFVIGWPSSCCPPTHTHHPYSRCAPLSPLLQVSVTAEVAAAGHGAEDGGQRAAQDCQGQAEASGAAGATREHEQQGPAHDPGGGAENSRAYAYALHCSACLPRDCGHCGRTVSSRIMTARPYPRRAMHRSLDGKVLTHGMMCPRICLFI